MSNAITKIHMALSDFCLKLEETVLDPNLITNQIRSAGAVETINGQEHIDIMKYLEFSWTKLKDEGEKCQKSGNQKMHWYFIEAARAISIITDIFLDFVLRIPQRAADAASLKEIVQSFTQLICYQSKAFRSLDKTFEHLLIVVLKNAGLASNYDGGCEVREEDVEITGDGFLVSFECLLRTPFLAGAEEKWRAYYSGAEALVKVNDREFVSIAKLTSKFSVAAAFSECLPALGESPNNKPDWLSLCRMAWLTGFHSKKMIIAWASKFTKTPPPEDIEEIMVKHSIECFKSVTPELLKAYAKNFDIAAINRLETLLNNPAQAPVSVNWTQKEPGNLELSMDGEQRFLISLDDFFKVQNYGEKENERLRKIFAEIDALIVDGREFVSLVPYMNYTLQILESAKKEAYNRQSLEPVMAFHLESSMALRDWLTLLGVTLRGSATDPKTVFGADRRQGLLELVSDMNLIVGYFLDAQNMLLSHLLHNQASCRNGTPRQS